MNFPILLAIASGNHKFGMIFTQTGMDKSNLTKYFSILDQLGEIKWTKNAVGIRVLKDLKEKAEKIDVLKSSRKSFLLVSKNGFTQRLQEMTDESLLLLDLRTVIL